MIGSGKSEEALLKMLQKNQELDMELQMKIKENQNLA